MISIPCISLRQLSRQPRRTGFFKAATHIWVLLQRLKCLHFRRPNLRFNGAYPQLKHTAREYNHQQREPPESILSPSVKQAVFDCISEIVGIQARDCNVPQPPGTHRDYNGLQAISFLFNIDTQRVLLLTTSAAIDLYRCSMICSLTLMMTTVAV